MVNKIELNRKRPDAVQLVRPGSQWIGQGGGKSDDESDGDGLTAAEPMAALQTQLEMRFEQLQNVIFARMVQKVGSKRYWEQWAGDVAKIAEKHIEQITTLVNNDEKARKAFDRFLRGLHKDINPAVSEPQAIEMLAQHIITQPVFEALFENYAFTANNPVSKAMNSIVRLLNDKIDEADHRSLENFYNSVRRRAEGIDNAEAKQKIVVELYDKFFTTAFPKVKEQLGIVYTPVEVVDFIIHSVEHVLQAQFGRSLNDRGVKIIDPFTGTGTFITRLLQSGIIHDLEYKYKNEIFANEIVLLAYYIASVNIENVYHDLLGDNSEYAAFPGICLTDTFELGEQMYAKQSGRTRQKEMEGMETPFVENSKRVQKQLDSPITVIIGNPPYSAGQKSANDNAQNQHYPLLELQLEKTYVQGSQANLNKSIYDSYYKAFRWATDRIDSTKGIIAFITNSGWIESNGADAFRRSIVKEFKDIYVIDLRGSIRSKMGNREAARKEGGNVFNILAGVAITILIKGEGINKDASIHYFRIEDYLPKDEKLTFIKTKRDISALKFQGITPNAHADWINLRNESFFSYIPIEAKQKYDTKQHSFFSTQTCGVVTSRDVWVYNSNHCSLEEKIKAAVFFYNDEVKRIQKDATYKLDMNPLFFSWDRQNKKDVEKGKLYEYEKKSIRIASYRPFMKQWLYFNRKLNNCVYQIPQLFPFENSKNLIICLPGVGVSKDFSCILTDIIPDYEYSGKSQCFPLYWYEERKASQASLFDDGKDKYIRHDAITDFILKRAQGQYGPKVTKEDIFYYVYGFLHCPAYRETFANDLKKMLPRLPLVEKAEDFWAFSRAGRELAELHLGYEQVPASKEVVVDWHNMLPGIADTDTPEKLYRVVQMKFGKNGKDKDKSVIEYNPYITLRNIPLRAYDYVVNGKSAIEWIMERYCDKVDKKSGIRNDANQWGIEHGNPKYPLELLQSIITLSLRTLDIVDELPKVSFE